MHVTGINFAPISAIFPLDFWTILTVWYILILILFYTWILFNILARVMHRVAHIIIWDFTFCTFSKHSILYFNAISVCGEREGGSFCNHFFIHSLYQIIISVVFIPKILINCPLQERLLSYLCHFSLQKGWS